MKTRNLSTIVLAGMAGTGMAQDAELQLPPLEKTDPVTRGLTQGFPPPPDKMGDVGEHTEIPERALGFPAFAVALDQLLDCSVSRTLSCGQNSTVKQ
jgi:hypothetical protein